jgi:4-amino-4-deoxy-L-arabinose transferase-like glycosyltransferase
VSRLRFPLAVLVAYAWLFPWLPELRSPNELSRLYQARAIADDHSLSLNAQLLRRGPLGDLSARDGRHYPNKAPGLSLLGAPVYAAIRALRGGAEGVSDRAGIFFLRLALCMVPGAIAAELLRRILARRLAPASALAGATVFALSVPMWPYSTLLMSHGPTAAALVAAWWALDRAREREGPGGRLLLAGFFSGLSVLLEYTSALMLLPLALYGLAGARRKARAAALLAAGALPPLLALVLYHQAAFGHPLDTGYRHLVNPTFTAWMGRGFMGLSRPSLAALGAAFLGPSRGLFFFSPFLLLALPGLAFLWGRDRPLALLSGSALALYGLFAASFPIEAWGWTVGPRHLAPLPAFLLPAALETEERLRARGLGVVAAALALLSVGTAALVMATGPYLPEELTNPVHQLGVPLAALGLHAHDLLGMALGSASPWTLAPWAALVALLAAGAARAFLPHGPALRRASLAGAVALAAVLFLAGGLLGGPDRFEGTRQFMVQRWEPVPGGAPGIFAGP